LYRRSPVPALAEAPLVSADQRPPVHNAADRRAAAKKIRQNPKL